MLKLLRLDKRLIHAPDFVFGFLMLIFIELINAISLDFVPRDTSIQERFLRGETLRGGTGPNLVNN